MQVRKHVTRYVCWQAKGKEVGTYVETLCNPKDTTGSSHCTSRL